MLPCDLTAKSRVQTSLASIRAGWFSTALVCSPVAPEFHPPPRQTSGQRTDPQAARLACPRNPRDRLRHRSARPIHRSFTPAKFRRSAALIGATNAPLKFSAALRPSSPHPSRQDFHCRLAANCKLKRAGHASCVWHESRPTRPPLAENVLKTREGARLRPPKSRQ